MPDAILILNAGSSSIKFALYEPRGMDVICRGNIEKDGIEPRLKVSGPRARDLLQAGEMPEPGHHDAIAPWLLAAIRHQLPDLGIVAAGHRVVHGGTRFDRPAFVDDGVLAELELLVDLAPGHEPDNIAAIRAVAAEWPALPQVACFDTAFHRSQPRVAQLFGIPRAMSDAGIIRYGFHGLSYEFIASVLPEHAGARGEGRVIVAHLGNGASMCAMSERRSVATSMGYTSLDGLMMGTRSGAIDPGVVLHLMKSKAMSAAEITDILSNKSGLLGVSGFSSDMRALEASSDPRAIEALDLFAFRARRELGALAAVLGGLDVLVFTAGIGEHSADMRARICADAAWLGITLDVAANARHASRIDMAGSPTTVLVIPTDEELVIARATRQFVLKELE